MVNKPGFIIHKTRYKKGYDGHDMIYKKDSPVTQTSCGKCVWPCISGIEKDFPEQKSSTI